MNLGRGKKSKIDLLDNTADGKRLHDLIYGRDSKIVQSKLSNFLKQLFYLNEQASRKKCENTLFITSLIIKIMLISIELVQNNIVHKLYDKEDRFELLINHFFKTTSENIDKVSF